MQVSLLSRILALACLLSLALPGALFAAQQGGGFGGFTGNPQAAPRGGFSGPGPAILTVAQAKDQRDDTRVALKGYIVQFLGAHDYLFKDDTGTITVSIGQKRWAGQTVSPTDLVVLHGEIDKDTFEEVEVDVTLVIKQ